MTFILRIGFLLGLGLVLAGCPGEPTPTNPTKPDDSDAPPTDDGTCTYVLAKDITVPSKLVNTPKACDYSLEDSVYVKSKLVIEPGVVVRAKKDALIAIDGGEFLAVGDAQNRIVFEGQNHLAGYWEGIRFRDGRESRLEYVDIKDAGQDECVTVFWCNKAGLVLDDVTVSLTNSSVSNSYVNGLIIDDTVVLTAFANNRFYGNTWAGLVTTGEYVDELDVSSDYSGGVEPNGTPYVKIIGDLESGDERVWKKLSTPYLIDGLMDIEGGIVTLEPGVEMIFGDEAWLHVRGNGELRALGTPDEHIIFRGKEAKPGYWDGVTFWDSNWDTNEFSYAEIHHSGNTESLSNAYGAIRLRYKSTVKVSNTIISDNAYYGISCDSAENSEFVGRPTLLLGDGNTFNNNAKGDLDPDCEAAIP